MPYNYSLRHGHYGLSAKQKKALQKKQINEGIEKDRLKYAGR